MKQDKQARAAVIGSIEALALAAIDASSHVAIEALEHTQKVLDHTELLARRLVALKQKSDKFADESRQVLKQQLLEICRDGAEVGGEAVKQAGTVARAALDEMRELGLNSESLLKELLEPALELPNPFRQRSQAARKSKEPTIIPISIQDN